MAGDIGMIWLAVTIAAAREPECAGRLYEGTLLEVAEALAIPGATFTVENARDRERLRLCTDATLTGTALNAWELSASLLGYCVEGPEWHPSQWECRNMRRRGVKVALDEPGLALWKELLAAVPGRTTEDECGVLPWKIYMPLDGTRSVSLTWLTPDTATCPGTPTCAVGRGLAKKDDYCADPRQ